MIMLIDIFGLYKNSYVAAFNMVWKTLSKLSKTKSSPSLVFNSSRIRSLRSMVPKTISLINFLNLCLGKSISLLKNT